MGNLCIGDNTAVARMDFSSVVLYDEHDKKAKQHDEICKLMEKAGSIPSTICVQYDAYKNNTTTLANYVVAKPLYSEKRILPILKSLFTALVYLHAHGIVHTHIDANNVIMANNNDDVQLSDFSHAILCCLSTTTEDKTTEDKCHITTPAIHTNEQLLELSNDVQSYKSDIFGVGCIAYLLMTGKLYVAGEYAANEDKHSHRSSVGHEFHQFVLNCIHTDPNVRPNASDALHWTIEHMAQYSYDE